MNRTVRSFFVLIISIGSIIQGQTPTEKLTLEKSINIALSKNTLLIKNKNNLKNKEATLRSAYGEFLPNLNFSASWRWNKIYDDGGEQVDYLGNVIVTKASEEDSRNYSLGVNGNWTLFDGLSNYSNLNKSEKELQAAKLELQKMKQDIVLQTQILFNDVIKKKYLLNVREENVKYNKKFLQTIKEKNKLGSLPLADLYSQQVQLGNAELALIQARNDFDNAKLKLLDYLSLDVNGNYEFESDFDSKEISTNIGEIIKSVEELITIALRNRADYRSRKLSVEIAKENLIMAKSGYLPRITGSYGFATSAADINKLFNRKTVNAGVNLSLPIFSNFRTSEQVQYAKVNELNAKEDLFAYERQIKMEIKQSYDKLISAKKRYEVSQKTVLAAKQTLETVKQRYEIGSATIVEMLKADKDYQDALQNRIEAIDLFLVQKQSLLNAIGKLDYKKYETSKK